MSGLLFRLAIVSSVALAASFSPGIAQQSDGMLFARTFLGACVNDFPNTERIESAAAALNWKVMDDPNLRAMFGPQDKSISWKAWAFQNEGKMFIASISNGTPDGRMFQACNVVQDNVNVEDAISNIASLLDAKKVEEKVEAGQRYTIWEIKKDGSGFLLSILDGSPMKMDMINASISNDFR